MNLKTGDNFKFFIHFAQKSDYFWKDVSDIAKGVGLSVIKTKVDFNEETEEVIDMIPCPSNYLDGFLSEYGDVDFY